MASTFSPRLDILPSAQRRLWPDLSQTPQQFILYGGTAIALQLGHRVSVDFDFFAFADVDTTHLHLSVPYLRDAKVIQHEANTLTCLIGTDHPVKVSFFGLPKQHPVDPALFATGNNLPVASLLDLAATKMLTVQSRAQAKDYLDVDALISHGITLNKALAAAKKVYGAAFEPTPTLKALTYFDDGDLPSVPQDVRKRLVKASAAVDPTRLIDKSTDREPGA
ncbi:nucleotidyl transferase AbiEii/AbiGii toxin family protein [Hyphomicrobium sp. NDB2Meth4]|uniref:nucleotidyl transferase AbiEii/AbiGii toxin family protein n=1 Tax=Hyphomicrobium sp. NDB2Meth4 TaxID=1892846 RepID=UPI000931410A|nr:nucleotidyl transferase AbiEii/AbiGii toxin family protein [Hyphomicrobium sp. NDB2Meth4]